MCEDTFTRKKEGSIENPAHFLQGVLGVLMSRQTPLNTDTYNSTPEEFLTQIALLTGIIISALVTGRKNNLYLPRCSAAARCPWPHESSAMVLSRAFTWEVCGVEGQSGRRRRTVQVSSGQYRSESVIVTPGLGELA